MWDTIVVGAGPGGISAALWAYRLGLRTVLLEGRDRVGGQVGELHGAVIDYPGLRVQRGYELVPYFAGHLEALSVPVRTRAEVLEVEVTSRRLVLAGSPPMEARSLILATGAVRRRLNVPGEEALWGRGVSDSPTRDLEMARGREVVVIGGGDGALENALILAEVCPLVTVIHRRTELRSRPEFQERVRKTANIRLVADAVVEALMGEQQVTGVRFRQGGQVKTLTAQAVFVKIGVSPRSGLLRGQVALDEAGFVVVDRYQETSIAGVYAVGDVCSPEFSSIALAVGQGMVAAKTVESRIRQAKS